jgi:hypothetical protein
MTIMTSRATMKIPNRTANATSDASSGRGRKKSSAGKNDIAPARVEEHDAAVSTEEPGARRSCWSDAV